MAAFSRIILFVIAIYAIFSANASPLQAIVQVRQQPPQAIVVIDHAFSDEMAVSEAIDSTPVPRHR